MHYYLSVDGNKEGPYERREILEMLVRGKITQDDPCMPGGAEDWRPVREVLQSDVQPASSTAPQPSPRQTYPAVRTLSRVYRAIAYIVLFLGIVLCIIVGAQTNNLLAVIAVGLYAAFVFLALLAGGELLAIMPDLADRTKETNTLLRDIKTLLSQKT